MKLIFILGSLFLSLALATKTEFLVQTGISTETPNQTNDLSNNARPRLSDPGCHRKDIQEQSQVPVSFDSNADTQTQGWNRNKNNLSCCTQTQNQIPA